MSEQDLYATLEQLFAEYADACEMYGREAATWEAAQHGGSVRETAVMQHAAREANTLHQQITALMPAITA